MTDKEVMRQALEALEASIDVPCYYGHPKQEAAAEALRAQLEQPVQEPVGYADSRDLAKDGNWDTLIVKHASEMREGLRFNVPLYINPPAAQRKPLTHIQAKALVAKYGDDPLNLVFQTEAEHDIREVT